MSPATAKNRPPSKQTALCHTFPIRYEKSENNKTIVTKYNNIVGSRETESTEVQDTPSSGSDITNPNTQVTHKAIKSVMVNSRNSGYST